MEKINRAAITNAISKIPANDVQFQTLSEQVKAEFQYYEIISRYLLWNAHESLVKQLYGNIGIITSQDFPEEVSCYNQIQEKSIEAYIAYKNQRYFSKGDSVRKLAAKKLLSGIENDSRMDPSAIWLMKKWH